jgi:hypothetical protein
MADFRLQVISVYYCVDAVCQWNQTSGREIGHCTPREMAGETAMLLVMPNLRDESET